ncbi:hypothetical protein B0H10DRAFT_2342171 [Mycena sp. CBHHK59/15]|nr:hypothetical protein B0H10DRAFT_2342171 [Mycena sp. CBHHK59/15]
MPRPHFALIIGIDEYECPKIPNLSGCVTDAKSFKECLSRTFGKAPDSDIMFLTNANATRAAILSAFRTHLICNEHIQRGQPIIIYFAGHGSRVAAPIEWAASSQSAYAERFVPATTRSRPRATSSTEYPILL